MKNNLAGYWFGEIFGTNQGGIVMNVTQTGNKLSGTAKIHEPRLGAYEYIFTGESADTISLVMTPSKNPFGLILGIIRAVGHLSGENEITGQWTSEIGTEGTFKLMKHDQKSMEKKLPKTNSVFIVHGHDEGLKQSVARFLEKLGVNPVILQEQINKGMTVIEKFEDFASRAGFAVVLMTPDDYGHATGNEAGKKSRPRQNVVLELGYFAGKLGRDRILVLTKGQMELPSDILGLTYEPIEAGDGWKLRLGRELQEAGYEIDLNKAIR